MNVSDSSSHIQKQSVDPHFCRLHDLLLSKHYQQRPYSVYSLINEHTNYQLKLEVSMDNNVVNDIFISKSN